MWLLENIFLFFSFFLFLFAQSKQTWPARQGLLGLIFMLLSSWLNEAKKAGLSLKSSGSQEEKKRLFLINNANPIMEGSLKFNGLKLSSKAGSRLMSLDKSVVSCISTSILRLIHSFRTFNVGFAKHVKRRWDRSQEGREGRRNRFWLPALRRQRVTHFNHTILQEREGSRNLLAVRFLCPLNWKSSNLP